MPALSASSNRRISSATAEKTSAGSIPRATSVATRRSAACSASRRASSSRLVSSAARFCALATAVPIRSVNCVMRCSVSGGSSACADPTAIAPHSRPLTWIGMAAADLSPSRR